METTENQIPQFTDEEINELNLLNHNLGYEIAIHDVMRFLKTLNYSDTNAVVIELRKEFQRKKITKLKEKIKEDFPNSTLADKLCDRLLWKDDQKK